MVTPVESQASVLRLIVVEDTMEDAERVISALRNAGVAVRPQRAESIDELKSALAAGPVDLVLASLECQSMPFEQAAAAVAHAGKDVALIALCRNIDTDTAVRALKLGTTALALSSQPDHLNAIIEREFAALNQRRAVRTLEAALRESDRRCDALITSSRDPIAYIHEGMHIRANDAYLEMFAYPAFEDIEGLPILDMVASSDAETFKTLLRQLSKGEQPPRLLPLNMINAEGRQFEVRAEFAPASYEGEACLQVVLRPQIVDREMAQELDELRQRDPATGLFNRQFFLQELELAVADAAKGTERQCMLLIAPDNYSALLGVIGLEQADALLAAIARTLADLLPECAQAARFSDHEFAILCHDSGPDDTRAIAERICDAFRTRVTDFGSGSVSLTVSVGGVQIGERIASVPQVLNRISQCLASAAGVGGNRQEVFDPSASDRAEQARIKAWVQRIRDALHNDGLLFHYQPIISLTGERREHYEAFLRMKAGAGEIVKPESFFAIAEEHGLLPEIDRWAVAAAIDILAQRMTSGHDTCLFVKISPASLDQPALIDLIDRRLATHNVPGERLVLELREAKVFTQIKLASEFKRSLAVLGVRTALEDFGAGLNPMQVVDHFKPEFVKLDRSLMLDLASNPENQKRVRVLADQAREAGMLCIADFVQDAASMAVLFTSGVDYVEGRFLASPGPKMNFDFSQ
ncbi:MAG TPA: PAS domain S-box protein [Xanthomonadales bacterium]|nr:PAS domain S-box protein [Xanthomonadales bacterium]